MNQAGEGRAIRSRLLLSITALTVVAVHMGL